jgi:hypothetical protein
VHDRIVCGDFSYCTFITTIDYVDMDGALLLAEDIAVTIKNGKVSYSERNGTGVLYYKHS